MRIKSIFVTILSFLCFANIPVSANLLPQPLPAVQRGWDRIMIDGIGSIDIPPEMEVQSQEYKAFTREITDGKVDEYLAEFGESFRDITIQPKGINDIFPSIEYYSRVLLETDIGKEGDYLLLTQNSNVNQNFVEMLGEQQRIIIEENVDMFRILEWYEPRIEIVNGMFTIKTSYLRQMGSNPPVYVEMYNFQNYDRQHRLTFSYRMKEKEIWEPLFAKMKSSFRITNFIQIKEWFRYTINSAITIESPSQLYITSSDVTQDFLSMVPSYLRSNFKERIVTHSVENESLATMLGDELTFSISYITGYEPVVKLMGGANAALRADYNETLSQLRDLYGATGIKLSTIDVINAKWEIRYEYFDSEFVNTKVYGITQGRLINSIPYYINIEYFGNGKANAERLLQSIQ